jgi:Sec-independent protein translocase protein TatA
MAWLVIFAVLFLLFRRTRLKTREAERAIADAAFRRALAMQAEAEALREAAQIKAETAARRGRPRKTTP